MELLKASNPPVRKILWALDPFQETMQNQRNAGNSLRLLFKKAPVVVQPVSVLLPGRFDIERDRFLSQWEELSEAARTNLKGVLKESAIPGWEELHLMRQKGKSVTGAVQRLLSYAIKEKSDLIVVSTHGRKGAERFFMGSFAETLVLRSPVPVLVVNAKIREHRAFKHIVFPTDFSASSKKAFDRVVAFAKDFQYDILITHKMEPLFTEAGVPLPPLSDRSLSLIEKNYADKGEIWAAVARGQGVDTKFFLDKRLGYALGGILKVAKRRRSDAIIAMASQSRALKSLLLGSLTRQLLRSAPCPVLIFHPHEELFTEKLKKQFTKLTRDEHSRPLLS